MVSAMEHEQPATKMSPNERDRGDGGIALLSHAGRPWPAAPHHERSA